MTHTSPVPRLRFASLLSLLAASTLFAQSGTPASVVELPGFVRDRSSFATGINDAGQIVGEIHTDFADDVAVFWDHGAPIFIGGVAGAGADSRATDINVRGQVVGYGYGSGRDRAFLWEAGSKTVLDALGGSHAAAAINDAGQIVGTSTVISLAISTRVTGVMWSGSKVINLGTFLGRTMAINNRGQIIISSEYGPVLWDNGVISQVPGLTSARDINDRGQILGVSDGRPVIWTYGMVTPLPLPQQPRRDRREFRVSGVAVGTAGVAHDHHLCRTGVGRGPSRSSSDTICRCRQDNHALMLVSRPAFIDGGLRCAECTCSL